MRCSASGLECHYPSRSENKFQVVLPHGPKLTIYGSWVVRSEDSNAFVIASDAISSSSGIVTPEIADRFGRQSLLNSFQFVADLRHNNSDTTLAVISQLEQ